MIHDIWFQTFLIWCQINFRPENSHTGKIHTLLIIAYRIFLIAEKLTFFQLGPFIGEFVDRGEGGGGDEILSAISSNHNVAG